MNGVLQWKRTFLFLIPCQILKFNQTKKYDLLEETVMVVWYIPYKVHINIYLVLVSYKKFRMPFVFISLYISENNTAKISRTQFMSQRMAKFWTTLNTNIYLTRLFYTSPMYRHRKNNHIEINYNEYCTITKFSPDTKKNYRGFSNIYSILKESRDLQSIHICIKYFIYVVCSRTS